MRQNLLPDMLRITLLDRDNQSVDLGINILSYDNTTYIFMADVDEQPVLARNASGFISQLVQKLRLDCAATQFVRHVFTPQSGSLFGMFDVQWQEQTVASYSFTMLNHVDEADSIREVLLMGNSLAVAA